jgi:crotonobetaine/carnitine-CoA ligase
MQGGGMEIRVVRDDDMDCVPGEIGELISRPRGAAPAVDYHGNKTASDEKTRGGWLRSGDMVHRDENGWLFFDFRKGGGLRRQGDFIMPEYVEAVIAGHPDVNDVCVFGIPASSGAPGESDIVAAIVPINSESVDIKGIFKLCLDKLEKNSVPFCIQVVKMIPKTASEKNLSRILQNEFNPESEAVFKFEDYG